MTPPNRRSQRRTRGIASVWLALSLAPMIGLAGLALDFGNVALTQAKLQNYVDAKAISNLKARFGGLPDKIRPDSYMSAELAAKVVTQEGEGIFDFKSRSFTETGSLTLLERQVPGRSARVSSLEVPLSFGPIVGVSSVKISAEAVAFLGRRQVVIVQDLSGSMIGSRIARAKQADTALIDQMHNVQKMPGDEVGIVTFDSDAIPSSSPRGGMPLSELATQSGALTAKIAGWSANNGTNVAAGLDEGLKLFPTKDDHAREVERMLILVGDGDDCDFDAAKAKADEARSRGINLFTILITDNENAPACTGGTVGKYFRSLPRLRGTYKPSPEGQNLQSLLASIVAGIPMHLAE